MEREPLQPDDGTGRIRVWMDTAIAIELEDCVRNSGFGTVDAYLDHLFEEEDKRAAVENRITGYLNSSHSHSIPNLS
jgi:hypothetical protein